MNREIFLFPILSFRAFPCHSALDAESIVWIPAGVYSVDSRLRGNDTLDPKLIDKIS